MSGPNNHTQIDRRQDLLHDVDERKPSIQIKFNSLAAEDTSGWLKIYPSRSLRNSEDWRHAKLEGISMCSIFVLVYSALVTCHYHEFQSMVHPHRIYASNC